MSKRLIYTLASLFIMLNSRASETTHNEPTTVKWIPELTQTVGMSVDINNFEAWNPSPFFYEVEDINLGLSGETTIRLVNNMSSLAESYGYDANLSARNLNFNIAARLGINKSKYINEKNLTLAVTIRHYYGIRQLKHGSVKLRPEAVALLKKNYDSFKKKYGDYYIASSRIGSSITILITLSDLKIQTKEEILASLDAKAKFGVTSVTSTSRFQTEIQKIENKQNLAVDMKYWGVTNTEGLAKLLHGFKAQPNLDTLIDKISEFLESSNTPSAGVPLLFSISSMSDYTNDETITIWEDLHNYKLNMIANEYFFMKDNINELNNILLGQDERSILLYSFDKIKNKWLRDDNRFTKYFEISRSWMDYLNTIKDYHEKCLICTATTMKKNCCDIFNLFKNRPTNLDTIPQFPSPLIERNTLNETKRVNKMGGSILDVKRSNLIPDAEVIVEFQVTGEVPSALCGGNQQYLLRISAKINSDEHVSFYYESKPPGVRDFNSGVRSFPAKIDKDGNLKVELFNWADGCGGNYLDIDYLKDTYIELRYKNVKSIITAYESYNNN